MENKKDISLYVFLEWDNSGAKIVTNEREISSLLGYFSKRVQYIFEATSKIVTNEREISSLLGYFSKRVQYIFEATSKIVTNVRKLCKRVGENLFLHATGAAKLR